MIFVNSFLKNKIIANKEPKCRLISNCRLLTLKSLNLDIIKRCADELTGINSDTPCTIDRIKASKYSEIIGETIHNVNIAKIKQLHRCISTMHVLKNTLFYLILSKYMSAIMTLLMFIKKLLSYIQPPLCQKKC